MDSSRAAMISRMASAIFLKMFTASPRCGFSVQLQTYASHVATRKPCANIFCSYRTETPVPPETHTTPKQIRISDKAWEKLEKTARPRRRAAVVIELVDWFNREPGAKLPTRPPRVE
jgi:hypothetical protein